MGTRALKEDRETKTKHTRHTAFIMKGELNNKQNTLAQGFTGVGW